MNQPPVSSIMGTSITVQQATFATDVLQASYQQPVLIDFFAHWCGPCQMLKPVLERAAQEYDLVVAKVDIDAEPELAQLYGVQGVPDVRVAVNGEVRDGFVGAMSDAQLRNFLRQFDLKSGLDEALERIYGKAVQGDVATAQTELEALLCQYPDDRQLLLEASSFYIDADQIDTAEQLLAKIPASETMYTVPIKSLHGIIALKKMTLSSPTPSNESLEAAFQCALQAALTENYPTALEGLVAIVAKNRQYRQDGARKAMLAIFDILGNDHSLSKTYRKQLTQVLY